jgi:hypothetical protein
MSDLAYPLARVAAMRVYPQFAEHPALAPGEDLAPVPPLSCMEALIETAFWASLRREEGYAPRISIAWVPPAPLASALHFERPLEFTPTALSRVAPAVERPGIHLGVWRTDDTLQVWGATRRLPSSSFVLEVVAPGLIVIKQSRGQESGKFQNAAVLHGDDIKVVVHEASILADGPPGLRSLLGFENGNAAEPINILLELAVSMREHGRGGALLVVPPGTQSWRDSVLQPIGYAVDPAFAALTELMQKDDDEKPRRRWQDAVRRAVHGIAGLTAVDGASVGTFDYELLAFGAKIIRAKGCAPVVNIRLIEPVEDAVPQLIDPTQLGGTRHLSAAQFTQDQRDAMAMVASQDGRFTVMAWSHEQQIVCAYRIDSLLL